MFCTGFQQSAAVRTRTGMWPTSAVAAVPIVERPDEVSKSFSADEDDRAKAGAHLQVGEPTVEPETDEGK